MISIRQALQAMSRIRPKLAFTALPLAQTLGRTLAEPVYAPIDLPPFARSAMDGYAVLALDTITAPRDLPVGATVAAGQNPSRVPPGHAVRIFTGAPLPDGTDAVIEQEAVDRDDSRGSVTLRRPVASGRNVMQRAHQYAQGDLVYHAGERLSSAHLGVLAGLGVTQVPVFEPLRVAVVQTGNEVRSAGHPLTPGSIYEVHAVWLPLLIQQWGGQVTEVYRVEDDLTAISQAIESVADGVDLVLITGGISVGDFDFVAQALTGVAEPLFWRVAMHPGRAVGAAYRKHTLILALSGNPAAALTSWSVLAAPWWAAVQHGRLHDRRGHGRLLQRYPKSTRETRFLRVLFSADGLDWRLPHSADVLSDPWNSGYALIPEGSPAIAEGTCLGYWQPSGMGGTTPSWQGTGSDIWTFDPPEEFGSFDH